MAINTILIVACLVAAFLLGRMGGGRKDFDGMLFLGGKSEDCHLMLSLSEEELLHSRTLMLKVVNQSKGEIA